MSRYGRVVIADAEPRDGGVMTVRTALALPPVRRGRPEVVAGRGALERSIRWVASGDVAWIARDLKGGELLLTTGLGIGRRAAEQRRYVDALCERGVAAVAIELGAAMEEPPQALVARAEQRGLPVIAFRRGVPFVEITEAIHGAIVNRPYALLRRSADGFLAPLVEHDARRKNPLLPTLEALCEHGWHKAAAARALLVPRQVLYQRIARIARLLDADPDYPRTRLGLELAVRARRVVRGQI